MSIQVTNITKTYGTQKALDGVSFSIDKNEIVGFLGPNGAGKSTLMKILTMYISPDQGEAIVNGHDIKTEPRKVQKSIGYLPEHNPLYLDMYVREYLSFNAGIFDLPKERIEQVIEETGLSKEAHKKISQLSKGYRQRVGLSCALLHQPDVLILDEPTTGLDPNQIIEIRNVIKNAGKDKTVFLSTHIMQEVEAICDRVIIINKGKIVADHTLGELTENQEQIIEIEFENPVENSIFVALENLKKIEKTDAQSFLLIFDAKEDMRPKVFDWVSENKLKIVQMNRKHKNLEAIFRELTTT